MICGFIGGFLIAVSITAGILKLAISLYNQLSGEKSAKSKTRVPDPSFGEAMGIMTVCYIVNLVFNFALEFLVRMMTGVANEEAMFTGNALQILIGQQLVSWAVTLGLQVFILHQMLPARLDQAILVTLIYMLITILVGLIIGACIFGILISIGVGAGLS